MADQAAQFLKVWIHSKNLVPTKLSKQSLHVKLKLHVDLRLLLIDHAVILQVMGN